MNLVSLVSNSGQRLDQNVISNPMSRYDMMVYGMPKCTHTYLKKRLEVASVVIFFLQDVTMGILENRSTTTKT